MFQKNSAGAQKPIVVCLDQVRLIVRLSMTDFVLLPFPLHQNNVLYCLTTYLFNNVIVIVIFKIIYFPTYEYINFKRMAMLLKLITNKESLDSFVYI